MPVGPGDQTLESCESCEPCGPCEPRLHRLWQRFEGLSVPGACIHASPSTWWPTSWIGALLATMTMSWSRVLRRCARVMCARASARARTSPMGSSKPCALSTAAPFLPATERSGAADSERRRGRRLCCLGMQHAACGAWLPALRTQHTQRNRPRSCSTARSL